MFNKYLDRYRNRGMFSFNLSNSFRYVCNAPADKSGVYLIYKIINQEKILAYIGSSGRKGKDGKLKIRRGGMKDRLINGYHPNKFGQPQRIKRHKAFPHQMKIENIEEIRTYWWVTFDGDNSDFPAVIESLLRNQYLSEHKKMPDWHQ
ncbi:MAG TPA: hypothetical protein VK543_15075 [Puia sp.]|nr:hypothetical protein [Puia sp.]